MGRPCVSGAGGIRIDYAAGRMTAGDLVISKGDVITIDGSTGEVIMGLMPMIEPQMSGDFGLLMGWADKLRKLKERTKDETPADADTAVSLGCEGIGPIGRAQC